LLNDSLKTRISASLAYIEANLTSMISLADIASAAHVSRFHYSRLFKQLTDESVMGYVRKRRLTVALIRLSHEDVSVSEIAFSSGFDSHEAFSRAFKKMFSVTPVDYKARHFDHWVKGLGRLPIESSALINLHAGTMKNPQILVHPSFKVVGYRAAMTSETNHVIPGLWEQLNRNKGSIPHQMDDSPGLGVMIPLKYPQFDYYAGVEVTSLNDIPTGMEGYEVEHQQYAVFTHRGPLDQLSNTLAYIGGTWLPQSGYHLRLTPSFELYDKRFNPDHEESEFDTYIPVNRSEIILGAD